MGSTSIFFIAIGLAMDALAVSIVSGFATTRSRIYHAFRMSLFFGLFQAVMPILGWAAGAGWREYIKDIDHWIAFGLLTAIGLKMVYESFLIREQAEKPKTQTLATLLVLSIATSIDAFAIGLTLSMLSVSIIYPAIVIGIVTFCVSLAGFLVGTGLANSFKKTSAATRILNGTGKQMNSNEPDAEASAIPTRHILERTIEMLGGLILLGIGFKILLEHLYNS